MPILDAGGQELKVGQLVTLLDYRLDPEIDRWSSRGVDVAHLRSEIGRIELIGRQFRIKEVEIYAAIWPLRLVESAYYRWLGHHVRIVGTGLKGLAQRYKLEGGT